MKHEPLPDTYRSSPRPQPLFTLGNRPDPARRPPAPARPEAGRTGPGIGGRLLAIGLLLGGLAGAPGAYASLIYQVITSFGTGEVPGRKPYMAVVVGKDGVLYGTTLQGGSHNAGTVFRLRPEGGGYQTLHVFQTNNLDGRSPMGLCLAADGLLYGTTSVGGTHQAGTVFRLNPDGSGYGVLHHFGSLSRDGLNPQAGLSEGRDGALYGTTFFGGSNDFGTVFKLKKDGTGYGTLRHFSGVGGDGGNPDAALVPGRDGLLYGTTLYGGTNDVGTVFKLNEDGGGFVVLRSFTTQPGDGRHPDAPLVAGADGLLYGTTSAGGSNQVGVVFRLATNGATYSILHTFSTAGGDGQEPLAALLEGDDGALYGTTYLGGSNHAGAIFSLNRDGTGYTLLRSFPATDADGQNPRAGLVRGSDGAFYGTTWSGGTGGGGTLFRLFPPQTPEWRELSLAGNTVQVRFAGVTGCRYQVLRSTNLVDWVTVSVLTMPAEGVFTQADPQPAPAAYYRLAWMP